MDEWKPALAMVAFTIIYAVMMGLVKKAMDEGMSELVIIMLRQLVGAVILFPIAFFKERCVIDWDYLLSFWYMFIYMYAYSLILTDWMKNHS